MKITELEVPGVFLLEPRYFEDSRGYYCESYSKRTLAELGLKADFVQDGHSLSREKGILRGIHFQRFPHSQTKLVRCTRGRILDVAGDLRKGSKYYTKWVAVELSEENRRQLWIPKGFGHAFMTLSENCELQYKVDDFYCPQEDRSVAWNDPQIAVDWLGLAEPTLSEKDRKAPLLKDSDVNFTTENC